MGCREAIFCLLFFFHSIISKSFGSQPTAFPLVSPEGICRSSAQVAKYIADNSKGPSTGQLSVVEIIDCITDSEEVKSGYSIINNIFGTSFRKGGSNRNGLIYK
jgi:hypothetical protein